MLTTEQFIAKNGLLKPEAFHLKHVIEADMTHFPACYPDELLTYSERDAQHPPTGRQDAARPEHQHNLRAMRPPVLAVWR